MLRILVLASNLFCNVFYTCLFCNWPFVPTDLVDFEYRINLEFSRKTEQEREKGKTEERIRGEERVNKGDLILLLLAERAHFVF